MTCVHAAHVTQAVGETPISTFVDGIDLERSPGLAAASSLRLRSIEAALLQVNNLSNRNVEIVVELWDQDQITGEPWVRLGSASMAPTSTGVDLELAIPGVDAVLASILERARIEGRLTTRFGASASGTPLVDLIQYRLRLVSIFEYL